MVLMAARAQSRPARRRSRRRKAGGAAAALALGRGAARGLRRNLLRLGVVGGLIVAAPQIGDFAMSFRDTGAECRVVQVVDGDTLHLSCPTGGGPARLTGYDAPELFSPSCLTEWGRGIAATQKLRGAIWRAERIDMTFRGHDRYGRHRLDLRIDGQPVANLMIASGHGRPYHGGARGGWCG
jgi:endonuclease YncB( thermonuclease family)